MKLVNCAICNKQFIKETDAVIHFISECKIPQNDEDKLDYWRTIIKLAFDHLIKKIANNTLPNLDKLSIEELRGLIILYSVGFVDKIPHFDLSKEDTTVLLGQFAPNSLIAIMEYGGLIKENENGLWSLGDVKNG